MLPRGRLKVGRFAAFAVAGELVALVDEKRSFEGLESVADAVEYMLSGQAVGKVVVRIGDP